MTSLIVQFTKSFDFAVLYPMIDLWITPVCQGLSF